MPNVIELSPKFPGFWSVQGINRHKKTSMRTKIAILCGLLMAAPLLHAARSNDSRFYVTPSVEYMFMGGLSLNAVNSYPIRGDLKFKDTVGLAVEAGFNLTARHILKLETGYFKTETEAPNSPSVNGFYGPPSANLKFVPVLLGYKYQQKINDKWQFNAGLSSGVAILQSEVTRRFLGDIIPIYNGVIILPSANYAYKETDYAPTFGGEVGVDYNLTKHSKLNLGVKCKYVADSDITTHGTPISVNLGYIFRF